MRGRWGGRRGSFKFFIRKFYEKINLSSTRTVTSKSDYLNETKKVEDLQYTDLGGIHTLDLVHQFPKKSGGTATATIFTSLDESTWVVPATGTYRVYALGGGGAGASGTGGLGGFFYSDISFTKDELIYVGVGAGGLANASIGNGSLYVMRGGAGGTGSTSGAGGGGSYIASNNSSDTRPNYYTSNRAFFLVAGGGGGSADHRFGANVGGHGFGVGGASWDNQYANTSTAGKNGWDGSNGTSGSGISGGVAGGAASTLANPVGGNGGVQTQSGGGGGGGAGGGAGGAAGGTSGTSNLPQAGGYFSTNTSVNGFTTEFIPRGGGGGGGHSGNCGGNGGGGGSLVFTGYNNSWTGSIRGTDIPHWTTSSAISANLSEYTAYNQFITDCNTYLGVSNMMTTLGISTGTAANNSNGQNGFVAIIPLQATTYTIV